MPEAIARKITNHWFLALLGCLALGGMVVTWVSTPWGVRAGYDSLFYLTAAQNVLKGLGLARLTAEGQTIPLTHFPPLYSLVVAAFSFLVNGDVLSSVRWTAVLIFGINIFLFGYLCYRFTHSSLAGVLGACFCLLSPILLDVNIAAFSEGLYIALLLSALYLINESLAGLRVRSLLLAAGFTALCSLTRYVGMTVILTVLAAILVLNHQPLKEKVKAAVLFGVISALPIAIWYLRNWAIAGSTTNRTFAVHFPGRADLYQALDTVTAWILPETLSLRFRLAIWLVILVLIVLVFVRWGRALVKREGLVGEPSFRFVLLLALSEGIYLFSLLVSRSFFDSSTRWEQRILSPLYITSALMAFIGLWNGLPWERHPWRQILLTGFVLLVLGGYLPASISFLNDNRIEGSGFTGSTWRNSQTMQVLKRFPPNSIFYSNNATAIYFVLGISANGIPERYDSVKAQARSDYAENLLEMRQKLEQKNTALVIFNPYRDVRENPPLEELTEGLNVYAKTNDGTVYVHLDQIP